MIYGDGMIPLYAKGAVKPIGANSFPIPALVTTTIIIFAHPTKKDVLPCHVPILLAVVSTNGM
jgi:hypothetical protein